MQCDCFFLENCFLVYMYNTHPSYRTSIVGKNCAYYIRIFTVTKEDEESLHAYTINVQLQRQKARDPNMLKNTAD